MRDHKAVNEKALALVGKLKVTPQDNDTSKSLVKVGGREGSVAQEASIRLTRKTK